MLDISLSSFFIHLVSDESRQEWALTWVTVYIYSIYQGFVFMKNMDPGKLQQMIINLLDLLTYQNMNVKVS